MNITLKPETAALILKRLETGEYEGVDDLLAKALDLLDAEAAWSDLHHSEVSEEIDRAILEFDNGGGIPARDVQMRLKEIKEAMLANGQ
jgi:hypothetical protein